MGIIQEIATSLRSPVGRGMRIWLPVTLIFMLLAFAIGIAGDLFQLQTVDLKRTWYLPLTLLIFPSFLEEFVFRGVLLRLDLLSRDVRVAARAVVFSSLTFTLWHPINALTINPGAQRFFLDPFFLLIVFLLGLTTGIGYLISRSLWTPVLIHWLTVVVWVFFLGGRNLVLEGV